MNIVRDLAFLIVTSGLCEIEAAPAREAKPDEAPDVKDTAWGGKEGGDAWGFGDTEKHGRHCRHGEWNNDTKTCDCYPGWGTAHITDTIDFFEGVCEQYHCESDAKCQEVLGIPGAKCTVPGWNCACGWEYAFMMEGHGYETPTKRGGGECMGVMYTFSVSTSMALEEYFSQAWFYALLIAVVFLPCGRKRFNCDHHRPSLWNVFRYKCGCRSDCDGSCVTEPKFLDSLMDELAWSVYILDLFVWSLGFFAVLYFVVLFIWSVVLWMAVIVITICLLIAALCMACGEGVGNAAGGGDCGNCCFADSQMGCGDCCMVGGMHTGGVGGGADSMFYFSGPWPYDPFWGYGGYGGGYVGGGDPDCGGGCCSLLCRPVAWFLFYFPVMPENMWGGVFGRCMGTRSNTSPENAYRGGNAFIDFLGFGWRRRADLHGEEGWRLQVHDYLSSEGAFRDLPEDSRPLNYTGPSNGESSVSGRQPVLRVAHANVINIDRPFTQEEDNCVPSSFDDYQNNQCWICADSRDQWDMWLSCHHLFCSKCSTQMLQRHMPCPLCRVASTTVLRGRSASS